MLIHFIRHGMTRANISNRISGARIDLPLSDYGKKKIMLLKEKNIYPSDIGLCFTSDLKRTQETFEMIYPNQKYTKTKLLRERDFGSIEYETDPVKLMEWRKKAWSTKGLENRMIYHDGEYDSIFALRVKKCFSELLKILFEEGVTVATICGHGGFLRQMCANYDIPIICEKTYQIKNGRGVSFEVKENKENDYLVKLIGIIGEGKLEDIVDSCTIKR